MIQAADTSNGPALAGDVALRVDGLWKKYSRSFRQGVANWGRDLFRGALGMAPMEALRGNEFWSLSDISFELKRGECLGVIGPNGAGKSTLLKVLSGIIEPTRGSVNIRGRVGSLIELGAGFHPDLTGRENVYINGAILGMSRAEIDERFEEIVAFADIGEFLESPVRFYSSGMKVRLGFAVAAHTDPDILLIDEVLAVGDYQFRNRCFDVIRKIRDRETSVLLISHNHHDLFRVCDSALVLEKGRAVFQGDVAEGVARHHASNTVESTAGLASWTNARVTGCRLISDADNTIQTGETVKISIDIEAEQAMRDAVVTLGFGAQGAEPFTAFSNLRDDERLALPSGKSMVEVSIPDFPFLPGAYDLHIWLHTSPDGAICQRIQGIQTFKVKGGIPNIRREYFSFRMPRCNWQSSETA